MPASIGVNLRVTGHCRQGGRKYMEDFFSVAYQQTEDERDLEYAFFGIYDGHGGAEAAAFAKERLMETIVRHRSFWSDNDEDVLRAIKMGYIATHYAMWKEQENWPRTASGLPSTAGTTASVAFIRRGKIYVGHVGDSAIVLGYQEPGCLEWKAKPLTRDHKPECANEMSRIQSCGGKVVAKSGVPRVVWNRPRIGHKGPVRRSTPIDEIPFLAVARSLGDLWSYNSELDAFVVSPDPDCSVIPIDTTKFRCLIFGTDGLFNMLNPQMAVNIVQQAEKHNEDAALCGSAKATWINPSKCLVEKALEMWSNTKMRADNTSVVTLMLDPPGPPRAEVLRNRRKNMPDNGLRIVTRYPNIGTEKDITKKDEVAPSSSEDLKVGEIIEPRESLNFHPVETSPPTGRILHKIRSVEKVEPEKKDDMIASSSEVVPTIIEEEPKPQITTQIPSEESIQINEVSSSSNESLEEDTTEDTVQSPPPDIRIRIQPFRKQKQKNTTVRKRRLTEDHPEAPAPKRQLHSEVKHNLRVRKMSVLESIHRRSEEMVNLMRPCNNNQTKSNKKSPSENNALKSKKSTNSVLVDKNVHELLGNCNSFKTERNNNNNSNKRVTSRSLRSTPKIKKGLKEKIANKLTERKILSKVKRGKLKRKDRGKVSLNKENNGFVVMSVTAKLRSKKIPVAKEGRKSKKALRVQPSRLKPADSTRRLRPLKTQQKQS